nr:helix-turn-helix transcriptional regulator [Microbacterium sp. MF43]
MNQTPGTVLRTLRERAGLSTARVAELTNVSESYLVRVESGDTHASGAWLGFAASVLSDALFDSPAEGATPRSTEGGTTTH